MGQGRRLRLSFALPLWVVCAVACGHTTRHPRELSAGGEGGQGGGAEPNDAGQAGAPVASAGERATGGEPGTVDPEPLGGAANGDGGATAGQGGGEGGVPATQECAVPGARFATSVVDHAFGGGQSFNQQRFPAPILGPPDANEPRAVVSLGNGGFVVLAFEGNAIVDGPGTDFTVFENPLPDYRELATVAVSEDGQSWHEFPCDASQDGPDYGRCAGVNVVRSSVRNGVDPLDPRVSGGDRYDLAELGVARARFVRITDRADLVGGLADVFDLDAVAIVNAACP